MRKLTDILKKIDKNNPGLMFTGNATNNLTVSKIPSGVFIFDYLTRGGIPEGRITIFHGRKSASKSTHSLRIAGKYQELFPEKHVVLLDFENAYDPSWGNKFLTDLDRFVLVKPDYAEQGIDVLVKLLEADDIGLVIVDSLAMMVPIAEAESDASSNFMGLQARVINKMFRKIVPIMSVKRRDGNPITFLLINQIRSNMGAAAFTPADVKPGGHMQDFVASLDVKFASKDFTKKSSVPVKATFVFTLLKNRVGLPRMQGEFSMYLTDIDGWSTGDIDEANVILSYARKHNLAKKEKGYWNILGKSFKNLALLQTELEENPDFAEEVKNTLIDQIKQSQAYVFGVEDEIEETESEVPDAL